jgi:hypothetical protein
MLNTTAFLIWFSMALGASESTVLEFWLHPKPEPKQWERSVLKNPEGTEIGVYYRGKFSVKRAQLAPDQIEYVFENDALVSSTFYFSEMEAPSAQALFDEWLKDKYPERPPEPSAVQKAADRVTTYFVRETETWKWVVNGSDITIRVSSNSRLPTALVEAVALGASMKGKTYPKVVKRYAQIHRRLMEGKTELDQVRALMGAEITPPLMKSDMRLVLAMMLSAAFRNAATHPTSPACQSPLLEEAAELAPQLRSQIRRLQRVCPASTKPQR